MDSYGSGCYNATRARKSRSNSRVGLRPHSSGGWRSSSFAESHRNSYAGLSANPFAGPRSTSILGSRRSGSQLSNSFARSGRNSLAGSDRGLLLAPPEVFGHMDNIITYWGPYTTLAGVVASPFYARVEIPVNPRHFEQWRNDVFPHPSLYHEMLPEVLSKATFTLYAVLPVPVRYLAQLSSLHLEYLARSLYDHQYEEGKNTLKDDASGDNYAERLKRTYTTLGRISLVYETRLNERADDGLTPQNMSDAIEDMLTAFENDLERIERSGVRGRARSAASPHSIPPLIFARTRRRSQSPAFIIQSGSIGHPIPPPPPSRPISRSHSPGFHCQSGNTGAPLDPRTRGKGFRAFFQGDRACHSAEDNNSARAQASSSPQSLPSTPGLLTMTISPEDMSTL
ncbi:hypothetical protein DPSP01_007731 [Paraphaeosphaeria sporulosa]